MGKENGNITSNRNYLHNFGQKYLVYGEVKFEDN